MFLFIILTIYAFSKGCYAFCSVSISTYYATTILRSFSMTNYLRNENCNFYFKPSYAEGYFLEIKWIKFDIEGTMPNCIYDSVEVLLTRSYKSIGKYCSDNIGSNLPFNMYSYDGYAMIRFKSDASTSRTGFRITYQLRRKSTQYMKPVTPSLCVYDGMSSSGIILTSGWPYKYGNTSLSYCYRRFDGGSPNDTRIALMDVNLQVGLYSCNSIYSTSDYLDIKQSSTLFTTEPSIRLLADSVSGRICGTHTPRTLNATQKYIYLYFRHPKGSTFSRRGFAVGHLSYKRVTPGSGKGSGEGSKEKEDPSWIKQLTMGGSISAAILVIGGIIAKVIKNHSQDGFTCNINITNCCNK